MQSHGQFFNRIDQFDFFNVNHNVIIWHYHTHIESYVDAGNLDSLKHKKNKSGMWTIDVNFHLKTWLSASAIDFLEKVQLDGLFPIKQNRNVLERLDPQNSYLPFGTTPLHIYLSNGFVRLANDKTKPNFSKTLVILAEDNKMATSETITFKFQHMCPGTAQKAFLATP
jgi:hypothetical protein